MNEVRPTLPPTAPLRPTTMAEATSMQERLVAAIADHFPDGSLFVADVGVHPERGRPVTTDRAERALAQAFEAPAAALVQGAGTGAVRAALSAGPWRDRPRRLLLHEAPDYPTTATIFADASVELVRVDFNNLDTLRAAVADAHAPQWLYAQHSRQQLVDSYDLAAVLGVARSAGLRTIVDDNYAAVRVPRIGVQLGASTSAFSLFKLHGPEGVGVVLGDGDLIEVVHRASYSGGGQVQGPQALDALRALVMTPLAWAHQSQVCTEVAERLAAGTVPGIVDATLANAQDRCVIALLDAPISTEVQQAAAHVGAAPYPVGANSRYEIAPLVYRLSHSSTEADPELARWAIRINPMRAGADLVLSILARAIEQVGRACSDQ